MINKGDIWVEQSTGIRVLILRLKDYMVTYQKEGVIHTKGDFEFKDDYKQELVNE